MTASAPRCWPAARCGGACLPCARRHDGAGTRRRHRQCRAGSAPGRATPAAARRDADRKCRTARAGRQGAEPGRRGGPLRRRARFCAALGNDLAEANEIERHLGQEGFAELILPRLPHATDFSLLMVLPEGENSIVSTSACSLALARAEAEPALRRLGESDVVLLQGNLSLDTTAFIL